MEQIELTDEEIPLLVSNFDSPSETTLVCYLMPTEEVISQARDLFVSIATGEFDMKCKSSDKYALKAVLSEPFSTIIKFSMISHPTKGFVCILNYQSSNTLLNSVSTLFSTPYFVSSHTEESCKHWFNCSAHFHSGYKKFHERFFSRFKTILIRNKLSCHPNDNSPICLDAICLPFDHSHESSVGFQEKRSYYCDVNGFTENDSLLINLESNKRVNLFIRYEANPTGWVYDCSAPIVKNSGKFTVKFVLSKDSQPPLKAGRWFFSVRGANVFSRSNFSLQVQCI